MHCGVDSRRVLWILLVVLAVVGGVAAAGAFGAKKQLAAGNAQKALEAGSESGPWPTSASMTS